MANDDETWGSVLYALHKTGSLDMAWAWMSDWRTRHGAQPWMLYNAMLVAWLRKRYDEVRALCEAAIAMPVNVSKADLRLRLAYVKLVVDDDLAAAVELLNGLEQFERNEYERILHELLAPAVGALTAVERQDAAAVRVSLTTLRAAMTEHSGQLKIHRPMRRLVYGTLQRIAAACGRRWLAAWYKLRSTF